MACRGEQVCTVCIYVIIYIYISFTQQHEVKFANQIQNIIVIIITWLMVSTPLKNISQLGVPFPIYQKWKMFQTTNQIMIMIMGTVSKSKSKLHASPIHAHPKSPPDGSRCMRRQIHFGSTGPIGHKDMINGNFRT